jgi:hypothetical protein
LRFSRRLFAMFAAVALVLAGFITYAFAAGVIHINGKGWVTCQHDAHANVANDMDVRNNGGQAMCVGAPNWGDDFTVYRSSVTNNWADFPNIFLGCELDGTLPQLCTSGHSTPVQVASIRSDVSSVSYYYPQRTFRGNSAYDIWFDKGGGQPRGRDNGAEIMIWLGSTGIGSPVYSRTVEIDGIWWGYDTWWAGGNSGSHWNYIRYWRLSNYTPRSSATLNLIPFFQDAERMGRLSSSWYLTGTEYGFEVCYGGKGVAVHSFTDDITMWKALGGLRHR